MLPPLLAVDTVLFTVAGYAMSPIEFFGTILNVWCVWLTAKNKVLSWPVGLIAGMLFFLLFWQIRLYSDMVEQVYFFVTGIWGWWLWTHPASAQADRNKELKISHATTRELAWSAVAVLVGTIALGMLMARIHLLLPVVFAAPADFPFTDAGTTMASFVATVLMMRKRVECWWLWIAVDIVGIWLYYAKGVRFISLEYVLFLGLATYGLLSWKKILAAGRV